MWVRVWVQFERGCGGHARGRELVGTARAPYHSICLKVRMMMPSASDMVSCYSKREGKVKGSTLSSSATGFPVQPCAHNAASQQERRRARAEDVVRLGHAQQGAGPRSGRRLDVRTAEIFYKLGSA